MAMLSKITSIWIVGLGLAGAVHANEAHAADCAALLAQFNAAVQSRSIDGAKSAEAEIAKDAVCGSSLIQVQNTRTALQLVAAEALPENSRERETLLADANKPDVSWKAAVALGELYFRQRRFADATNFYMRAIELMKNLSKTPRTPDTAAINEIVNRAGEARLLAADEDNPNATFVASAKDHRDGGVGGIMSEDIRGIRPVSVPLPIRFDTNSAKLTKIGIDAVAELATAIKQQRPGQVIIVGHTDSVGSDDYNMRLSAERLKTVDRALREAGVVQKINGIAMGKREPLKLTDQGSLTPTDINALNR